jgi:hypothetical protein
MFLDSVVKPNADALFNSYPDMRLAVNATLTLDAFFGILHADLRSRNDATTSHFKRDYEYRDDLADRFPHYRILRDTAASLKHGALTGKKPRLVEKVHQLHETVPGAGVMMCGHDRLGETAILIQIPASNSYERPEFIVGSVLKIAEDELSVRGL